VTVLGRNIHDQRRQAFIDYTIDTYNLFTRIAEKLDRLSDWACLFLCSNPLSPFWKGWIVLSDVNANWNDTLCQVFLELPFQPSPRGYGRNHLKRKRAITQETGQELRDSAIRKHTISRVFSPDLWHSLHLNHDAKSTYPTSAH